MSRKYLSQRFSQLLDDIQAILPSEIQLDLKDPVYESRLVETESNNNQRDRLPLSLLRIPSDLQFNIFHFLNHKDLIISQRICHALCIAARNPLSHHSLEINISRPKTTT